VSHASFRRCIRRDRCGIGGPAQFQERTGQGAAPGRTLGHHTRGLEQRSSEQCCTKQFCIKRRCIERYRIEQCRNEQCCTKQCSGDCAERFEHDHKDRHR
jgi:hypothetical protein